MTGFGTGSLRPRKPRRPGEGYVALPLSRGRSPFPSYLSPSVYLRHCYNELVAKQETVNTECIRPLCGT